MVRRIDRWLPSGEEYNVIQTLHNRNNNNIIVSGLRSVRWTEKNASTPFPLLDIIPETLTTLCCCFGHFVPEDHIDGVLTKIVSAFQHISTLYIAFGKVVIDIPRYILPGSSALRHLTLRRRTSA